MIRINLLPHREERRKAQRQQFYALAVLVTLIAGAVWFVGYGYLANQVERQAAKNLFLGKEIKALDDQIEEIKKLKEQTESLLARKRVIESLQANRTETVYLFNELAHRLPAGIYLRSIKQEHQKITLVGHAQSNARVSALMHNLDESPVLERPVLAEIKAVAAGKRRANEFNMHIHFTRQTSEGEGKVAKKPGGSP